MVNLGRRISPLQGVISPFDGRTRSFSLVGINRIRAMRRLVLALISRFANRHFVFAFVVVSVLSAKVIHIYSHLSALPIVPLLLWGYSFFAQDMMLLVAVRFVLDGPIIAGAGGSWLRSVARGLAMAAVVYVAVLATVNVSFFAAAGSEIHWRDFAFAGNASSRELLLTGIGTFALVLYAFTILAWAFQDGAFRVAGIATDRLKLAITSHNAAPSLPGRCFGVSRYDIGKCEAIVGFALLAQLVLYIVRPKQLVSLTFMSWTPALLPLVDFNRSPNLERILPLYGSGINYTWDNRTALDEPIVLSWLPENMVLKGFEDWYSGRKHYSAAADPLKVSNTDADPLPLLRNKLEDVPIRHIMLILLESTRKDVFPVKKGGLIWERFASTFKNKTLPEEARRRLETLNPYARLLTGDYDDGFEHDPKMKQRRGGLNFNDAYTTGTYTIKSMVGTLCGVMPLVADFNKEYAHHIYQPCLPQILEAFSTLDSENDTNNFSSYRWRSSFFESVMLSFDKLEILTAAMGFPDENIISKEYLRGESAKFGTVHLPDINYFGMPEACLEDYIRDAFSAAKHNKERVFLTHLTSTSHHPFAMPAHETYVPLSEALDDLSHYVNAIGYDDRWLGKIFDILDREGVSNETLLVLAGDHGLSIPESGMPASYYNPNVGNNHIPLVISHPKLPAINVDDAVSSLQVLPTILDLLVETNSLSPSASSAARDLISNYEGQSLLRPLRSIHDGITSSAQVIGHWQFTVINPGSAMLGVRDGRSPYRDWRLVVPIVKNIEWRFTSLDLDPTEEHPTTGFDYVFFLRSVEKKHGINAARWAEEGAFLARWWVEDNRRRWRYGQYAD